MRRYMPNPIIIAWAAIYIAVTVYGRWRLAITPETGLYVLGSMIGVMLLSVADYTFADLAHNPLRSLVGEGVFIAASMFVITSSTSITGVGVVLGYFVRMIAEQLLEYADTRALAGWDGGISPIALIGVGVALLIVETIAFI